MSYNSLTEQDNMLSKYVHTITFLVLFTLFCQQFYKSVMKYNEGKTTFSIREVRKELQQYPSVTVCPSLPLKKKDGIKNFPISVKAVEDVFKKDHKTIHDTFYFVDHPSKSNKGFPCMTTRNSYDPVKPCQFPFILSPKNVKNISYANKFFDFCIESGISNERFCPTKVGIGNSSLLEEKYRQDSYGFCRSGCNGEIIQTESEFNLAKVMILFELNVPYQRLVSNISLEI